MERKQVPRLQKRATKVTVLFVNRIRVTEALRLGLLAAPALSLTLGSALAAPTIQLKGRISGYEKLVPEVSTEPQRTPQTSYAWRIPWALRARFPLLVSREICVVAFPANAVKDAPPLDPVLIKVTGGRTNPVTLVVTPGTRIAFKNGDPFAHDLTSAAANWSRAPLQPGGTREWSPTAPGVAEFRDEFFPSVRTFVVAEKNVAAFAFPSDKDGSFVFSLPAGDYTLKAYFGGHPVGKPMTDVKVPQRGPAELKEALVVSAESK